MTSIAPVIDCDGHVIEPDEVWPRFLPPQYRDRAPRRVRDELGFERVLLEGKLHRRGAHPVGGGPRKKHLRPGASEPRPRLEDMDLEGIQSALLFPTIAFICFSSVSDPAFATALCRAYNDWIAAFCGENPDRLRAVALVPLHQDVHAAIEELHRAVGSLGLRGVGLRPNAIGGRELSHESFEPFWTEIEKLGVPVCLHEGASALVPAAGGDRFDNYLVRHLLSHPLEQMVACTALVMGGVLERHPRMKVAFLESGAGWVPYLLDRMDEHVRIMGHLVAENVKIKPSEYFKRQCFVACEADEACLPAVIDLLGDDNIVFASDYPHFNGTFPGAARPLREHPRLPEASIAKILRENAARLLSR